MRFDGGVIRGRGSSKHAKVSVCRACGMVFEPVRQMGRLRRCAAVASRAFPARPESIPAPVRLVNLRLKEQMVQQLLADYQAGRSGRELAERYGLARSTVIGLLRQHGVAVRYPRVTPDEAAEMVRLYRSGVRQGGHRRLLRPRSWQHLARIEASGCF
jgi:hypothetical protein